jgi:hypothetical protein
MCIIGGGDVCVRKTTADSGVVVTPGGPGLLPQIVGFTITDARHHPGRYPIKLRQGTTVLGAVPTRSYRGCLGRCVT